MDFNTDYSLSLSCVNAASKNWYVSAINETTGATIHEMTIPITNAIDNVKGKIRLDTTAASAANPPYFISIFVREASTAGLKDTVHIYAGALTVTGTPAVVRLVVPTTFVSTGKVLISP